VAGLFGRIDGLVAGAAVQPRANLVETPAELWEHTIAVNLNGIVWACQAVVPHMLAQRSGAIVAYSSGLARFGRGQAAAYAASKGAIEPFVKSLAAEVAEAGIRVNVIYPGVIDTEQFQLANPTGPEREHWQRTTGIGSPTDVLGPLLFLLSDAATMSGSTLTRDRAYPETMRENNDGE
jgi:3-oxoacyl-[acyl-carrier protein] reductase